MDTLRHLKKTVGKLLRTARSDEAAILIEETLRSSPLPADSVERYLLQGVLNFARGEYLSSVEAFDRALQLDPTSLEAKTWRLKAIRRSRRQERQTETYLTSHVGVYRAFAASLPTPDDTVVELGASTGSATVILARRARLVIAVEKTEKMYRTAASRLVCYPNVILLHADAWETGRILEQTGVVDVVFVDIGGSAAPWQTMELAQKYQRLFTPRILVLRNTKLNDFVAALTFSEHNGRVKA
jgi:protein-L-isoaspartate O-methyltransferase